jgi:hypothetical protein
MSFNPPLDRRLSTAFTNPLRRLEVTLQQTSFIFQQR